MFIESPGQFEVFNSKVKTNKCNNKNNNEKEKNTQTNWGSFPKVHSLVLWIFKNKVFILLIEEKLENRLELIDRGLSEQDMDSTDIKSNN